MQDITPIKKPAPKIDITHGTPAVIRVSLTGQRNKRNWLKILMLVVIAVMVILGTMIVLKASSLTGRVFIGQKTTFFGKIKNFVTMGRGTELVGEDKGQINILLLGIGGEGHDGPYLSDTMLVAQIRPKTREISMTSLPRDYLVNLPEKRGEQKINAAFALGFAKNKDWGEAGSWAREVVENISGLSIPYFAVVDFSGFEKAVDEIGGLPVHIDRSFSDSTYPNSTNGYLPTLTFKEGSEQLNGVRALQFARSRHGTNAEGSDFARSQRQQKIINAFKTKLFGLNILSDISTVNKLLDVFADHFHTNLSPNELLHLYNISREGNAQILSSSLDPETGLICSLILESTGAYVLTPCPGKSTEDVKNFFQNSLSVAKLQAEQPIIWLASSTGNKTAYQTAYRKLTNAGITVFELSYSTDNLPSTIVYMVNPKAATLEFITNVLKATEVNLPPPDVKIPKEKVDAVVILGTDAPSEAPPKPYIQPPARKATTTPDSASSTLPSTATTTTTTSTKK